MPLGTADQIRRRPILVTVPGTDLQIQCRVPDVLVLIADGILPLPIFGEVLDQITTLRQDGQAVQPADVNLTTYWQLVNRWVCAAAESPRFVLTEDEALADPSTLWVEEIDRDVRLTILERTNQPFASSRLRTAVQTFRRQ